MVVQIRGQKFNRKLSMYLRNENKIKPTQPSGLNITSNLLHLKRFLF